jgi:hypothetical protein
VFTLFKSGSPLTSSPAAIYHDCEYSPLQVPFS